MLTELEVTRKWRALFKDGEVTEDAIEQAQMLIDELHPESPLRVRFGSELHELRARISGRSKEKAHRKSPPNKSKTRR